jgi:site-specific recombinase XerD
MHTFGTWLGQNGVDIYTMAQYMGHKDLRLTQRCMHRNTESLRVGLGAVEKMNTVLRIMADK